MGGYQRGDAAGARGQPQVQDCRTYAVDAKDDLTASSICSDCCGSPLHMLVCIVLPI